MLKISKLIKKEIGNTYFMRGKKYFQDGLVGKIEVLKDPLFLNFEANVNGYDVGISVDIAGELSNFCDCPCYFDNNDCKHIGALSLAIDENYKIDEDLNYTTKGQIIGQQNNELENSSNDDEHIYKLMLEHLKSMGIYNDMIDQIIRENKDAKPVDILRALGVPVEGENHDKKSFRKKQNRKSNGLQILENIPNNKKVTIEEDIQYKIKLDFTTLKPNNIKLNLIKANRLKNGKFGVGKAIFRSTLDSVKNDYQKLKVFLSENSNTDRDSRRGRNIDFLGFNDLEDLFIETLFENRNSIYNTDNEILELINKDNDIFLLKFKLVNTNENKIGLAPVFIDKDGKINEFNGGYMYGKEGNKTIIIYDTIKNILAIFKCNFGFDYLRQVLSEPIVLSKEEFQEFRKNPKFNFLLNNVIGLEDVIDDEIIIGAPKERILINIPSEFDKILTRIDFDYGDNKIVSRHETKEYLGNAKEIIKRNFEQENKVFDGLNSFIDKFDSVDESKEVFTKNIDDNIDVFFDLVEKMIEEGKNIEYKQKTKRIASNLTMKVDIKSGEDWFDTKLEMKVGDQELEEYSEVFDALKQGKKYLTLKNGMTILLKEDYKKGIKELEELGVNAKNAKENIKISKYNIGLLKDKKLKGDMIDYDVDKEILKLKKSLSTFKGLGNKKLSENIKAELRDYQKLGFNWMNFLQKYGFSGILADDMGLGKTLQTLSLLQKEYDKKTCKTPSLIIVPTSLVLNWMDEAEKFTPNLKIEYIKDGKTGFSKVNKSTQIIIVSYGIIANLVKNGLKKKFYYLILDESQNIKNPVAGRTKAILQIQSKYRLCLSGTPLENNLIELWSAFNFLMPSFLGNLNNFRSKYIGANAKKEDLQLLSHKIKPFILRRTKEKVLKDLPPKVEEVIKLEMGDKQKKFYNKLKTTYKLKITKQLEKEGLNKARFEVLDALLKLRQACLMPELVKMDGNNLQESIKIKYIEENIEDMISSGHNLLVFSQFTGFLSYVQDLFEKLNIDFNYIDGKTSRENRKKQVDSFNAGKVNVFLISLKAGGTGLNLTSADYVIHLDPWWNPAVENQATDRAHRMGQKKTVFVHKLIIKDSIEEKILNLQEKKKKLIDDIFSGDFSGNLTKGDIDYIFE